MAKSPPMILAGVDEAGYGPTLGPLVVSAVAFRVPGPESDGAAPRDGTPPQAVLAPDLWQRLQGSVSRKPDGRRIAVDDSKKLYGSGKGLDLLEEGALTFLEVADGAIPSDLRSLLRRLTGSPVGDTYLDLYPWYRGRNLALPAASYRNRIRSAARRLAADLDGAGIRFLGARAIPLEVQEFNESVDRTRSKALVSFHIAAGLLGWIWRTYPREPILATVDRQGGRMRYGPQLYQKVRARGIRILEESGETSSYELLRKDSKMQVTFTVDGDGRFFPVALASMYCKYLRELHMTLFNRFWLERVSSLKPTAGYAVDARRFLSDIAPARSALAIDDAALIRKR